jgi:hypothetical protein
MSNTPALDEEQVAISISDTFNMETGETRITLEVGVIEIHISTEHARKIGLAMLDCAVRAEEDRRYYDAIEEVTGSKSIAREVIDKLYQARSQALEGDDDASHPDE